MSEAERDERCIRDLKEMLDAVAEKRYPVDAALERLGTMLLARLPQDPERPVLTGEAERHRRRREAPFCGEIAASSEDDVSAIDAALEIDLWMTQAGVEPLERACLLMATDLALKEREIARITGLSYRSVRRYKAAAVLKLRRTRPIK